MITRLLLTIVLSAIAFGLGRTSSAFSSEGTEFFERKIRPVLAERCYSCHSEQSDPIEADLRLDIRITDPSIATTGKPNDSLLIQALRYTNSDLQMPPDERLRPEVIADFEKWVSIGMPDPRATALGHSPTTKITSGDPLWSFQAPQRPELPAVQEPERTANPIDRFVIAQLEQAQVRPLARADRPTLIRRAYFDLIGLPPSPTEVDAFLHDDAPDAFARLIDRLLASYHYGERWGRHWLDIARYGDCNGGDESKAFPHAYHYRNYVIDAFNQDLPYDEFLVEHIAGDLPASTDTLRDPGVRMIGTGFLALATKIVAEKDTNKMLADVVDEQIDTFGRAMLGLTLGCARCHDHKFDPITTRDYYALAGIFHSTKMMSSPGTMLVRQSETREYKQALNRFESRLDPLQQQRKEVAQELQALLGASQTWDRPAEDFSRGNAVVDRERYGVDIGIVGDQGKDELTFVEYDVDIESSGTYVFQCRYAAATRRPAKLKLDDRELTEEALQHTTGGWMPEHQQWFTEAAESLTAGRHVLRFESEPNMVHLDHIRWTRVDSHDWKALSDKRTALTQAIAHLEANRPAAVNVYAVTDGEGRHARVHLRGNHLRLGDEVPRSVPEALRNNYLPDISGSSSGRKGLAAWLTSREHPLTARVFMNRMWRWHFGQGLVRTPDNFGRLGDPPTHPHLLDYLALRLIDGDWSIKSMHRLIMTSETYQRAGRTDKIAVTTDPDNRLLWRFPRRRLEAEAIRDAMLHAAGRLDHQTGGAPLTLPTYNLSPERLAENLRFYESSRRRSVYLPVLRTNLYELFSLFDFANPDFSTGDRASTTTPTQALLLMNSPHIASLAADLAGLINEHNLGSAHAINALYMRLFSRHPTERETAIAKQMLEAWQVQFDRGDEQATRAEAWRALCHTLLVNNEFFYVN